MIYCHLSILGLFFLLLLQIIQKSPGRAGEKAADVLDNIRNRLLKWNPNNGLASRGNRISILAFEVANTIARGANLLQSLSEENIQALKKEILHPGVQQLVSTDIKELLSFAAADKRLFLVRENSLLLP